MQELERFVRAQEPVWPQVVAELQAGRKQSHWMWFVFPQLQGLGQSRNAWYYGLADLAEARAYWAHPVLGPRLKLLCGMLLQLEDADPLRVMGWPDNLKLCSCMTLFAHAAPAEPVFRQVLNKFYGGREDGRTVLCLTLTGLRKGNE